MDGLGFGGQRVGDAVFQPFWVALHVFSGEETRFVVFVVDIIGVVVKKHFCLAVFHKSVDDAFFSGSQSVETSKNDALFPDFSQQISLG